MMLYLVTPAYNAATYLDQTIESVVAQNIPVRHHVQDGGSSDGTLSILQAWDSRLKNSETVSFSYASDNDNGMYDAINRAFASFDTPLDAFMGWINADDILHPGALAAVSAVARNAATDVDWVYGLSSWMDSAGEEARNCGVVYYPQQLVSAGLADGVHWSFFQQEGCFFRKRLWDKAGGCDTAFRLAGDWDLWRRMAAVSAPVQIPAKLGSFRVRPGQLSSNLAAYQEEIERNIPLKTRQKRMLAYALSGSPSALRLDSAGRPEEISLGLKTRIRCCLLGLGLGGFVRGIQSVLRKLRQEG